MKTLLTIILFIFISNVYSQQGWVTTKFIPATEDAAEVNTTYFFSKKSGLVILLDSIDRIIINEKNRKKIASNTFSKMSINYLDSSTIMQKRNSSGKLIRTAGKLAGFSWVIDTTVTKVIAGFLCFRATSDQGQNGMWEGWFTKEIPVPSPGSYNLPGLLLESSSKYGKSVLINIKLEKQDPTKFQLTDGELVSNDKYFTTKSKAVKIYEKAVKAADADINKD